MKRNESAVGGQLWIQGDRQMTASSLVMDGVTNNKEGAILTAGRNLPEGNDSTGAGFEHRRS
jgi:hypothetical protein